jgi:hypothetical protein
LTAASAHAAQHAPGHLTVAPAEAPAQRMGTHGMVLFGSGKQLWLGERLTATGEAGQPVRLTVQREHSFLTGPDFTP